MARPSSVSNVSRLATSTTLIPDAAICRANSLPIPDEGPVTSAHGPNCPLSSAAFIVLFLSVDGTCCSIVRSHSVPIQSFRRFTSITVGRRVELLHLALPFQCVSRLGPLDDVDNIAAHRIPFVVRF